ncbi:hypothetical protein HMI56_006612 [Coelomomyces lativittatus]|nr:hypothetical protein HMI56_006612 [Coelomomyces lativittatus]
MGESLPTSIYSKECSDSSTPELAFLWGRKINFDISVHKGYNVETTAFVRVIESSLELDTEAVYGVKNCNESNECLVSVDFSNLFLNATRDIVDFHAVKVKFYFFFQSNGAAQFKNICYYVKLFNPILEYVSIHFLSIFNLNEKELDLICT